MDAARANRIAWIGWGVSLVLGYLAPVVRAFSGVRRIEIVPIGIAVVTMLICLALMRPDRRALSLAIHMNLAGLLIGATGGFVMGALATGKMLGLALALQFAFGGAFLMWLFRRDLHEADKLTPAQEAEIAEKYDPLIVLGRHLGVPPEEVEARLVAMTGEEREEVGRFMGETFDRNTAEIGADLKRLNRRMALTLGGAALLVILTIFLALRGR